MSKIKVIILGLAFLIAPLSSNAQISKPFGGKSTLVIPCTCDMTFMVTILDAASLMAPINYIYSPISTQLYAYFLAMMPGVYMVGLANPLPTQCMVTSPSGCTPVGFGYTMTMVGTSL